jgi:hypothetical protein
MLIRMSRFIILFIAMSTVFLLLPLSVGEAQNTPTPQTVPIEFLGKIETITPDEIVVDQLPIDVRTATLSGPLRTGQLVNVKGVLQPDGSLTAETIEVINTDVVTPTPFVEGTPKPTAVSDATITQPEPLPFVVLEGAVEAVNENSLLVNGLNFMIDSTNPVLATVREGDLVRIEGLLSVPTENMLLIPTNIRIDRYTPPPNPQPVADPASASDDGNESNSNSNGDSNRDSSRNSNRNSGRGSNNNSNRDSGRGSGRGS